MLSKQSSALGSGRVRLAQDCTGYYYAPPGADIEMRLFDRKGNPSGRMTYPVKEARQSAKALDAVLTLVTYDEKGKELAAARDLTMPCRNGTYRMDLKNFVMPETMNAFDVGTRFSIDDARLTGRAAGRNSGRCEGTPASASTRRRRLSEAAFFGSAIPQCCQSESGA